MKEIFKESSGPNRPTDLITLKTSRLPEKRMPSHFLHFFQQTFERAVNPCNIDRQTILITMAKANNTDRQADKAREFVEQSMKLTDAFFDVMERFKEGFTADAVVAETDKRKLDQKFTGRYLPALFRSLKARGIIKKLTSFKLSTRNDSKALPVWQKTTAAEKKEAQSSRLLR